MKDLNRGLTKGDLIEIVLVNLLIVSQIGLIETIKLF